MDILREGPFVVAGLLAAPAGIAIGLFFVYRAIIWMPKGRLGAQFKASNSLATARVGAFAFGILSLPAAVALGFFIGAYMGGGLGTLLGRFGGVIGMALGAGLVAFLVGGCAAIIGFLLFGWLRLVLTRPAA